MGAAAPAASPRRDDAVIGASAARRKRTATARPRGSCPRSAIPADLLTLPHTASVLCWEAVGAEGPSGEPQVRGGGEQPARPGGAPPGRRSTTARRRLTAFQNPFQNPFQNT